MKKLIALMLVASFTGAVIAQQAPVQNRPVSTAPQTGPATAKTVPGIDDKNKKKHHRHHHRHHEKPATATK
jgi:hypothetical protein